MEVLTYFGERADFSPDNQRIAFMAKSFDPVIATDGRTAAFQIARTTDEAGVGYGIVLLRLSR